jgi:hypothetical protein
MRIFALILAVLLHATAYIHQYKSRSQHHVKKVLHDASGVYRNKTQGLRLGLSKTILLTTIAYNSGSIAHYKKYFQNFLCFVKHYEYDIVIYFVQHEIEDFDEEVKELTNMGLKVLTYPDYLFWRLIKSKNSSIKQGKHHSDYNGTIPSFKSFGSLVMLVPVLEVLNLGYNAIFLDVDLG